MLNSLLKNHIFIIWILSLEIYPMSQFSFSPSLTKIACFLLSAAGTSFSAIRFPSTISSFRGLFPPGVACGTDNGGSNAGSAFWSGKEMAFLPQPPSLLVPAEALGFYCSPWKSWSNPAWRLWKRDGRDRT